MVYSFQVTVAAWGYHVYKPTTWDQAKYKLETKFLLELRATENQKKLTRIAVPSEHQSTNKSKQLDTKKFSREIPRHVYCFLKDEYGHFDETVKSIDYRPSPIPAGGLEIPLTLNFKCPRYITHIKMKEFMSTFYSFDYDGKRDESSSDEEINLFINESSEESQSNSEVVIQTRKKKESTYAMISEFFEESQTDSHVVNLKR